VRVAPSSTDADAGMDLGLDGAVAVDSDPDSDAVSGGLAVHCQAMPARASAPRHQRIGRFSEKRLGARMLCHRSSMPMLSMVWISANRAHLHEAPEQAVVALHNAGLLADDVQHEDPFVLFDGAGALYQYWTELRQKGAVPTLSLDACISSIPQGHGA